MSTNNNSSKSEQNEIILAQEQSVTCKDSLDREVQGTLVLTNKRLLFVAANEEQDFVINQLPRTTVGIRYADVEDLSNIPGNPSNLSIPLTDLELEKGHEGFIRRPKMKIKWREGPAEKTAEFTEDISNGGRKRDLKDWPKVIESIKNSRVSIQFPSAPSPNKESLEGRILYVLGDMQEKGVFEIEKEVEDKFSQDLDPDEVDAACQRLTSQGFLDVIGDSSGDNFYRKRSPLGEDDLSS